MIKDFGMKAIIVLLISAVLLLGQNYVVGGSAAMAQSPQFTEAELTSLDGDIYVNPEYVGKVRSVRTIDRSGLLGDRVEIVVRTLTDGWRKFSIPPSLMGAFGVIISGESGILKISLPEKAPAPAGGMHTIENILIEFGTLNTTFVFPGQSILEPSKYEIGILDNTNESFVSGKVIAMKSDQAAVSFQNLPSTVVNSGGKLRASLKKPDGTYVNADLPAWGYNIIVPETDVGTPAPIRAEVFGLPADSQIRFDFSSLADQIISPSTQIMTVQEINGGATVATITTKIGGPQPLTVTVKKVQ